MNAVEKYTSAHSFGARWKPVERQAYNRSLQSYFDNCRSVNVHDDWSVAKTREECQSFTFTFYAPHDEKDVKAQEKFTKGLTTLEKKIVRERKAREKRAA